MGMLYQSHVLVHSVRNRLRKWELTCWMVNYCCVGCAFFVLDAGWRAVITIPVLETCVVHTTGPSAIRVNKTRQDHGPWAARMVGS